MSKTFSLLSLSGKEDYFIGDRLSVTLRSSDPESKHIDLEERLKQNNITFKSYMRIANTMISEYTKSFGRLLYKLNKDIDELNKTKLDTPYFGIDNNN